ncbi:hypothetical protein DM02DRAFT_693560 [Periconia macrospinosa]|uniref:Uncharacterized protein n=1 Tax=Periconia macrospinosa TaxID=97972 RepID=A0A2V1DAS2_9PLEO|nr:hypothetical protein DM02DRAFT_693560 [Periconia macrospinosa]
MGSLQIFEHHSVCRLVPTSCIPWPTEGLRRISVDSFGFGGANSHAILDDALHTIEALALVDNHRILTSPILSNWANGANGLHRTHGVNGVTGVNGVNHTVEETSKVTARYQLLAWSARDEAALKRMLHLYDGYHKASVDGGAEFIGNLAYTLAMRRSIMAWRSFAVVDGQEAPVMVDLTTAKRERATRDVGVAFIFTGQGAQYANMGIELLHYPVFKATLSDIDRIYQELGAEWTLFDKIGDKAHIHNPEFSQPLCTAIQIALVKLLETFNIFPDVVIGHSSGEVAAAYTVGALSLRSACEAAFHRGRLAGRIAATSTLKPGAMMSVNLAESEAETYLAKASLTGRVSVACINSPNNVTISGDENAIDQLQKDLEKDEVFARKIKTGVAYHSPAMHEVSEEYLSSMGRLEPRELQSGKNPVMVSTVTGQMAANTNLLKPQYWVDNLVSPVRFADALQYIVHTAPRVDGLKPITNYLEIGPHGALQRPVRDSLAYAGNSAAQYNSALSKQDSPSKTILQLVGQLFISGYRVSITTANQQDLTSQTFKPLVNTPEYPFDRTLTYWHESRVSRDWRLRKEPSHSLLGSRTSDWNPLQPRWRKMLKVEEVPWIADHVVDNLVVFPAVGSIVMAIEAVRQTVGGNHAIRGYHVKEATFTSPIIITPGGTTEVMTHLHPLQQQYERSSTRFEVEIFSYSENYWRACNKHIIHVEYERESRTEVDGGKEVQLLTESIARRNVDTKSKAHVKIPTPNFYRWLEETTFRYGPTFSLADNVYWDGENIALAQVDVGPPVDSFKEGLSIPASSIHAYNYALSLRLTECREAGWQNSSTNRVDVLTEAKLKSAGVGFECEVSVLSETGTLLCYIKELEMLPLMARKANLEGSERKLLHYIDWKPHLSLCTQQRAFGLAATATEAPENENSVVNDRIELESLLRSVAQQNFDILSEIDGEKMPAHIRNWVSWTDRQLQGRPSREIPAGYDLIDKLQDLAIRRPSWKIFTEVAQTIPSILRGEPKALEWSLSSESFRDYLDGTLTAVCNRDAEAYLELLAHQKPTQRILEIGAHRGVLTSFALSVFQNIEADTGGAAFSYYMYSDTSTALLEDAPTKYPEHQSRMGFMRLDVNQDLLAQGVQPASYDVIFSASALRGVTNISSVLQNLRRVLKPGGQLVLHEFTAPDRFEVGFGLGITADWWLGQQDDSHSDRTFDPSKWDVILRDNGFTGTDLVIRDFHGDVAHCSSLIVSKEAGSQLNPPRTGTKVLIVIDDHDDFQRLLADSVFRNSTWTFRVFTLSDMVHEKLDPDSYIICLADVYRPCLHPMKQQTLKTIRTWVEQFKDLFWVTAVDAQSAQLSSSYPYAGIKDGLLRTLRSEFAFNRIVSLTLIESTRDVETFSKYIHDIFDSVFIQGLSEDVEYMVQDGQILTGRLVDDKDANKALTSSETSQVITEPWLPGPPLTLAIETRGQLETLHFKEDLEYYKELDPKDVEIEAKVWGVGFRDVFLALGRLEENDFGADCAGIVTRVGAEVQSFKAGDRVCGQAFDCMKSYPRLHEWSAAKIEEDVSFETACASVIPGMTAVQSFLKIARLQKGERVLIHSASGSTGQVALQIAQTVGAEVFATVGYESKKQLLMDEYNIPADHIFYSRDASFAQGIMRITNGYGVDVALNSLAGELLRATWECMAPYGRLIEIGKAEINANAPLPMASFAKNNLFAGVDLRHIVRDLNKTELTHELLQKTMDLVRDGSVRAPNPLHIYDVNRVEDAFRYLASGKSSGRILIRVDPSTQVQKPLINRRTWKFNEDATYIVAGGLGGIGRSILRWMVTRGAKHLLVPSRSGPTSSAASEVVRELFDQNIVVSTPRCDVSSKDAVSQMLEDASMILPPIQGCIVATMALNDCLFENMTLAQWEQTSSSKVEASWNLHTLLPKLDFFILLSSVSGVVGNPGQSNYAAGCTFQDTLARHRSQNGQKAISIDLGIMRSIGVIAESERLQKHFQSSKGFMPVEETEFLSLLDICCDPSYRPEGQQCQIVMGLETPVSLLKQSLELPEILQRPLFARFSEVPGWSGSNQDSTDGGVDVSRLFSQADTVAERAQIAIEALSKRLARTLSIKFEDVDTHQPLHAYGVDSLIAVELRTWLGKEFATDVPVFEIVSGKTIKAVGEMVAKANFVEMKD